MKRFLLVIALLLILPLALWLQPDEIRANRSSDSLQKTSYTEKPSSILSSTSTLDTNQDQKVSVSKEPTAAPKASGLEVPGSKNPVNNLPEDLRRQLEGPPPELPEDLKAQLENPSAEIPEDIKKAMDTPPRSVTIEEVNTPSPVIPN